MAVVAGKSTRVSADASDSSYSELSNMQVSDFSYGMASGDSSQFGDTGARLTPTISQFSGTISGVYNQGDTGQGKIRTAITSRATVYIKILLDGTNGYKCCCVVNNMKFGSSQTGMVTWSFDFQAAGGAAPTAVSSP